MRTIITKLTLLPLIITNASFLTNHPYSPTSYISNPLHAIPPKNSLRPAAEPLMDSGKALARSGELLIDYTNSIDQYGGGLSSAGAAMRNGGDYLAQAAASTRFKTAAELVSSELREAGDCLLEASGKLALAMEEFGVVTKQAEEEDGSGGRKDLSKLIPILQDAIVPMKRCGDALEGAGAAIVKQMTVVDVGKELEIGAEAMLELSALIGNLVLEDENGKLSSQRLAFASTKMKEAGNKLTGTPIEKPKGKAWLKGGLQ